MVYAKLEMPTLVRKGFILSAMTLCCFVGGFGHCFAPILDLNKTTSWELGQMVT